jgi:hypothetical protein
MPRNNGKDGIPNLPITALHPDPERHLLPLDDDFPAAAEAAFAQPVARSRNVPPGQFPPIHCRAWFKSDLRFGRNGIAEITVQIPHEHRHQAFALLEAAAWPLEMYIRPCHPNR